MVESNSKDNALKRQRIVDQHDLPDCLPCKLIGAGMCFACSSYLLYQRSVLSRTKAARYVIGIASAGRCHSTLSFEDTSYFVTLKFYCFQIHVFTFYCFI